jgi:hypothetical protein
MAPTLSKPVPTTNIQDELEVSVDLPLDQAREEDERQKLRVEEMHIKHENDQSRGSWQRAKDVIKDLKQRTENMKLPEENKRLKRQLEELTAKVQSQTILPEKEHPAEEKSGLKRKREQLDAKVQTQTTLLKKKHPATSARNRVDIFDMLLNAAILMVFSHGLSGWLGLPPAMGFVIFMVCLATLFLMVWYFDLAATEWA